MWSRSDHDKIKTSSRSNQDQIEIRSRSDRDQIEIRSRSDQDQNKTRSSLGQGQFNTKDLYLNKINSGLDQDKTKNLKSSKKRKFVNSINTVRKRTLFSDRWREGGLGFLQQALHNHGDPPHQAHHGDHHQVIPIQREWNWRIGVVVFAFPF